MQALKDRMAYWIGGTVTALAGIAMVRLLAPALSGMSASLTAAFGYALVIVGITILARAARRKGQAAFVAVDKEAAD